jgi:hypothetical protein
MRFSQQAGRLAGSLILPQDLPSGASGEGLLDFLGITTVLGQLLKIF